MSKLKITSENMIEIPIDKGNPLTINELELLSDDEVETTRTVDEQESTDNKIVIDVRFYRKN